MRPTLMRLILVPLLAAYFAIVGIQLTNYAQLNEGWRHVITTLARGEGTFVPYRNHKLTQLLSDSIGGNAKTVMIEEHVVHAVGERIRAARDSDAYGLMEWQALVRTV